MVLILISQVSCCQIVFEEVYAARDSATLEQLKELSSKRRMLEESINESSSINGAIAREMSGGLTSRNQQVIFWYGTWYFEDALVFSCRLMPLYESFDIGTIPPFIGKFCLHLGSLISVWMHFC